MLEPTPQSGERVSLPLGLPGTTNVMGYSGAAIRHAWVGFWLSGIVPHVVHLALVAEMATPSNRRPKALEHLTRRNTRNWKQVGRAD